MFLNGDGQSELFFEKKLMVRHVDTFLICSGYLRDKHLEKTFLQRNGMKTGKILQLDH